MERYRKKCKQQPMANAVHVTAEKAQCKAIRLQPLDLSKIFQNLYKLNCKSKFLVYLMECFFCKTKYLGKGETSLSIHLNNHRSDVAIQM